MKPNISCWTIWLFSFTSLGICFFASNREVCAQQTAHDSETRFTNRLANELIKINRPIEDSLAIDFVQERLELPRSTRQSLNQIFANAESEINKSTDDYASSMVDLKIQLEMAVKAELDLTQTDDMQALLELGSNAEPSSAISDPYACPASQLRRLWPQTKTTLIPLLGTPSRLVSTDNWLLPHVSAKDAVRAAEKHLKRSITNLLTLNDRLIIDSLGLSNSQLEDLNNLLETARDTTTINNTLPRVNAQPRVNDQPHATGSSSTNEPRNTIQSSPMKVHAMMMTMMDGRSLQNALNRDFNFRKWASQNLTQRQIDQLFGYFLQSFEKECTSASVWCLVHLAIDLQIDQVERMKDLRLEFIEAERESWQSHLERCRKTLLNSNKAATDMLDSAEYAAYNKLLESTKESLGRSGLLGLDKLFEAMPKKQK